MTVRPANEDDLDSIYALYEEWREEDITPGIYAANAEALKPSLGPFFLAAEGEDRILDFLLATRREAVPGQMPDLPQGEPYLEIEELYVRQGCRDQGVGTRLMEAFLDAAREHGLVHAYLYSSSRDWRRFIGFYERFGFRFGAMQMYR